MTDLNEKEYKGFEDIKHKDENGEEYWFARELADVLEYKEWRNFSKAIDRAMLACRNSGFEAAEQFAEVSKSLEVPNGGIRKVKDYKLSRYACYLIVQNGDPRKEIIALGQTYFSKHIQKTQHKEKKGEIVLYHPDSSLKLEVLVDDETVWLTQAQMADLFQTTKQNIGIHINNAFKEGELENDSVVKESFTTAPNGKSYRTRYYNLDVIISVGYRVKSLRGTIFRRWATKTLKEYILKGYAINQRFERVEYRLAEHDKKIDFFVSSSLPPVERVFYEGQFFDAYAFVADLIKSAKESIVLLDNYVDESVLLLLSKRSSGVPAEIFTRDISPQLRLDINKHNKQFEPAIVRVSDKFHDRYLIIDHTVYIFGSSLKDLGKKRFTFIKLETKDEDILEGL